MRLSNFHLAVLAGVAILLFAALSERLARHDRQVVLVEMEVALPRWVQTLMGAGDRYLAANLGGFRSLVASTQSMSAHNFRIQAMVQQDVAWLNPSHEDNYYVAAAILPWNGEVEAAQRVLASATASRLRDPLPPFFYGFGLFHFFDRPAEGAEWVNLAASRMNDENQQAALKLVAAQWYQKANQPEAAVPILRAMAESSRNPALRQHLQKRIERYDLLIELRAQAHQYRQRYGRVLKSLNELVSSGIRRAVPVDPLGQGYSLDASGEPILLGKK